MGEYDSANSHLVKSLNAFSNLFFFQLDIFDNVTIQVYKRTISIIFSF